MNTSYLKIAILAAVADGEIQGQETTMLSQLQSHHPLLAGFDTKIGQHAVAEIYNKVSAGMKLKFLIDEIGGDLTKEQKNAAYALAREICAADFNIFPAESDFLKSLEEQWKISKSVKNALDTSIALRYFT